MHQMYILAPTHEPVKMLVCKSRRPWHLSPGVVSCFVYGSTLTVPLNLKHALAPLAFGKYERSHMCTPCIYMSNIGSIFSGFAIETAPRALLSQIRNSSTSVRQLRDVIKSDFDWHSQPSPATSPRQLTTQPHLLTIPYFGFTGSYPRATLQPVSCRCVGPVNPDRVC